MKKIKGHIGVWVFVGCLTITVGLTYLAVAILETRKGVECNVKVEYPNLETVCSTFQDWGYANGAVMAKRMLGENEYLRKEGLERDVLTCEDAVEQLYTTNLDKANWRP